jgi:hypothetical protein
VTRQVELVRVLLRQHLSEEEGGFGVGK